MRSSVVLAGAASVLALAIAAPGAGARTVTTHGDVLLLEAAGKPVSTTFRTDPARSYTITVTGVYSFNGTVGMGLADCGHKDPEDMTGWIPTANVLLDNRVASCSVQPFTPTHTYSWTQQGTGAPFVFVIFANAYTHDDTGCLAVAVIDAELPVPLPGSGSPTPRTCWRPAA